MGGDVILPRYYKHTTIWVKAEYESSTKKCLFIRPLKKGEMLDTLESFERNSFLEGLHRKHEGIRYDYLINLG
jgi:hypothetical protein